MEYIADKVKADGSLMKPDVYKGYRSGLTYLFTRYGYKPPDGYMSELSRYMQGAARIANDARQHGEVRFRGRALISFSTELTHLYQCL